MSSRRVAVWVVLPPRVLLLDVAGPIEVLRRANVEQSAIEFDIRYVGPAEQVTSSVGLEIAGVAALPEHLPDDAFVIVPGTADNVAFAEDTPAARVRRDESAIVKWLKSTIRPTHTLVSICSGALLAGRAGLLDGYECTTHFTACADLARVASQAKVLENRLFVIDRNRYTSAGVTAGTDLMLHLISEMIDHSCALAIARHLVVYLRREGSDPQISPWLQGRNHIHRAVHRAQDAVMTDPAAEWSLTTLARIANTSPRHLSRLFNEHSGMSLTEYINRLRVSLAREMLKSSRLDMETVAERTGFGSARQLRRAWSRCYASPPHQARHAT